jgi:hypothetical protein
MEISIAIRQNLANELHRQNKGDFMKALTIFTVSLIALQALAAQPAPQVRATNMSNNKTVAIQILPPQSEWQSKLSSKELSRLRGNPQIKAVIDSIQNAKKYGGGDAGGGNITGLQFYAMIKQAIYIVKDNELPSGVSKNDLYEKLSQTLIGVTSANLYADGDEGSQPSDALNFPTLNTIIINQENVSKAPIEGIRNLGLHELFSLMGYESTGNYSISSGGGPTPHFGYVNFDLPYLPPGTEFIITRPIDINAGNISTSLADAVDEGAPKSGYWLLDFTFKKDMNFQRSIRPRTCRLAGLPEVLSKSQLKGRGLEDTSGYMYNARHFSLKLEGDSICQQIEIIFTPENNNDPAMHVPFSTFARIAKFMGIIVVPPSPIQE